MNNHLTRTVTGRFQCNYCDSTFKYDSVAAQSHLEQYHAEKLDNRDKPALDTLLDLVVESLKRHPDLEFVLRLRPPDERGNHDQA